MYTFPSTVSVPRESAGSCKPNTENPAMINAWIMIVDSLKIRLHSVQKTGNRQEQKMYRYRVPLTLRQSGCEAKRLPTPGGPTGGLSDHQAFLRGTKLQPFLRIPDTQRCLPAND